MSIIELGLPEHILIKVKALEDKEGYLNRNQIAAACEVAPGTVGNWMSQRKLPTFDNFENKTKKIYWLPKTVADFIYNYRKNNNKPLA